MQYITLFENKLREIQCKRKNCNSNLLRVFRDEFENQELFLKLSLKK
jgi:hypothetical protein